MLLIRSRLTPAGPNTCLESRFHSQIAMIVAAEFMNVLFQGVAYLPGCLNAHKETSLSSRKKIVSFTFFLLLVRNKGNTRDKCCHNYSKAQPHRLLFWRWGMNLFSSPCPLWKFLNLSKQENWMNEIRLVKNTDLKIINGCTFGRIYEE